MTAPPDNTTTDLVAVIATLRTERDAALAREAALDEALATRNSEYGERIEYQAATLDVLRAMSASPGDPQPVFDLIVERARDLCEGYGATILEFDGRLLLHRASTGIDDDPAIRDAIIAAYPKAPVRSWPIDLAVLERRLIIVDDLETEPKLDPALRNLTHKSVVAMPLMRGEVALGALALGGRERGGFSHSQIELLKTFAEQAVIAITSAATYRALQERTEELAQCNSEYGERIEHQSATIDVLKAMSASPGDAQPVFDLIARRAKEVCNAPAVMLFEYDGELVYFRSECGSETGAAPAALGAYKNLFPMAPTRALISCRAIMDRQIIEVRDVANEPGLLGVARDLGHRSNLAVPLLRDGAAIGVIGIISWGSEGFSDSQIELMKTFADQAVIAISSAETYRALQTRTADLQETLEYQTATSDVLKVISRSTFDLHPVLAMVAETAARLCLADQAAIHLREGDMGRMVASVGFSSDYVTRLNEIGAYPLFRPDSPSVLWRAAGERRAVHIHDAAVVPGYSPSGLFGGQRTSLGVPLLREGEPIGVIVLARQRVEPFTERQIDLVSTFADQAVIAIENTRLITEQREALGQQTATAEVLQVINGSPGNLTPVFDAMLEKALRLCESAFGILATYDGKVFVNAAFRGVPPELAEILRKRTPRPDPGLALYRVLQGEDVVQIADIAEDDAYRNGIPGRRAMVDLGGAHTQLLVALRKDETLLGTFLIFRQEVRPFTEKQVALLQAFAAQAVIAMDNARLLAEQREALEQQTATAEVLQVINASPGDLTPVFDAMLEKAMRLCEAAFGLLYTYDGDLFHTVAHRGVPAALAAFRARHPPSARPGGSAAPLIETKRPVHILDMMEQEFYRAGDAINRATVDLGGARTTLTVPLLKDNALVGAISIYRQELQAFSAKQITLLENFAAQAVIAMENARLLTETREALEQQTATAEVLQVINASPGDLAPVFSAILEKSTRLCDTAFGALLTYDGELWRPAAVHGPAELAEFFMNRPPWRPATESGIGRHIVGEDIVHFADLAATDLYAQKDPGRSAYVELGQARTAMSVALRKDDILLGAVQVYRQKVRSFGEREIALLQSFAAQAVIAMENARLLTETREALEQQTATAEVLKVINASPGDLAPVFDAMVERAATLCEADEAAVRTFDGSVLNLVATHGPADNFEKLKRLGPSHPDGLYEAIAQGASVTHFVDVRETEAFQTNARARERLELRGIRSWLAVALRKEGALLGVINVHRREVRPFTDKQIAVLQNFAAQAVIAIENARLLTETREALEQQTATAEVLQVINSSPGDPAPVFDAMLEKAMRLCGAAFGFLAMYDGEQFKPTALRGVPDALASYFEIGMDQPRPGEAHWRLLVGENLVHNLDQMDEDAYRSGNPLRRAIVDLGGARSVLVVALRKDGVLLGALTIYRKEVRPFSSKQIALLQSFAAQAVIAIENARLISEQREALEQQTATAEVLQVINSSPGDLAPVFEAMLEKAMRLCGAAFGTLWTYDGERVQAAAYRGVSPAFAELMTRGPYPVGPENAIGRLLRGEQVVHIADCAEDQAYRSGDPMRQTLVALGGGRTLLAVPLWKDETFLGSFVIYRTEVRLFSNKQIALLQSFAGQAVIAMENARLLHEIRQRQEELRVTFENMGDGVAMFDETQHLVAWNRKFQDILDVPDDIIARHQTFSEYVHYLAERGEYDPGADPAEHIRGLIEKAGQSRTYERTRPDGRVIEIRHNPVPAGGFVLIYADITERKRSEAEIRAARDAAEEASRTIEAAFRELKVAQANLIQGAKMASLGQLTAGIAHEIKNPLNFVNNFAALSVDLLSELKETAAPGFAALSDSQRAEIDDVSAMLTSNLEKITEHGKRADGIVKAMLEHSRGPSGERRQVDINTLADEALNLAYHGARAQDQSFNITLERDFSAGIAPIEVNPQDMTRVFLNIFSNGFYATTRRAREGGDARFLPTLKVTTRDAGDAVEIRVRDNGIGIPTDIRDKLFQPFFTTKPTGEGTGLGLSISYDIVTKQHGGSITLDSKVGEFSEFTIRLPCHP